MQNVRESLWLPAAVLAVGVALMFVVLSAAGGATPAGSGPSAYPSPFPCLYLPLIRQNSGPNTAAQATNALQIAPAATAYPPPGGACGSPFPPRRYLPMIQR